MMAESGEPRRSAWHRRASRVMGNDPDDPSLALPKEGEWVLDPKRRVQRWESRASSAQNGSDQRRRRDR